MIGLREGTLELSAYDPEWPVFFGSEKLRIEKAIGQFVLAAPAHEREVASKMLYDLVSALGGK
jgi:hypothetical protein